jgi:hypothetical protein
LQQELDRVRGLGRDSMAAVEQGLTSVVAARITKLGSTDPAGAMQLRAGALKLFPTGQFRTFPVTRTPPPAATPQPVSPGTAPPPAPAGPGAGGTTQAEVARNVIAPAAPASVTTPQVDTPATAVTTSPVTTAPAPATARPVVAGTGKPCEANLAGKGQLGTRAGCRDGLSSGGTGPELVVIAAGDGGEMFAIARNETSVGEYDAYCAATGCAVSAGGTAEIPMTGASAAAAEKYSAWLSSVTGQKYRLPTEAEWRRAAGTAPDPKANCVVQNNGVVTRGTSLRPANQGDLNALGLRHAVGNVQEWAGSASAGWKAMGGAVGDPIASCLPSLARAHNGAPDGKTGFRLVREMR